MSQQAQLDEWGKMEEMTDSVRGDLSAEKVYMRTLYFKDLSWWLQNEMRLVSVYKILTKT